MGRDELGSGRGSQRRLTPAQVPPGPLRELKELLYRLYLAAGPPTLDDIAAAVNIAADELDLPGAPSRDTINRVIGAAAIPPSQADTVSVAVTLARMALWRAEDIEERVRRLWVEAHLVEPAGVLAHEADPYTLEVHPAIEAGDIPGLPRYVDRGHDQRLGELVDAASAGKSSLVVLIGNSSTGKTRACWEAVQRLPAGWRIWHPYQPTRAAAALADLDHVAPRTVVWLNEAQHYLLGVGEDESERIAAGIRSLLTDRSRSPVLILATLWPEHWHALTAQPMRHEARDPYAQARTLLTSLSTQIAVPQLFSSDEDLQAAQAAAQVDARIKAALSHGAGGEITQYLAGAPVLMDAYRNAPPGARALIEAAMDARRLGHNSALPHALLAHTALEYLTDREFDELPDDWQPSAFAYCAQPCRGARGPLTRSRTRHGGDEDSTVAYHLADYLEQHGRSTRQLIRPPGPVWTALIEHGDRRDLLKVADAAERYGLRRVAMQCRITAADAGHPFALVAIAQELGREDHLGDPRPWLEQIAGTSEAGDFLMAMQMSEDGRTEEALVHYQRAGAGGFVLAYWMAGMTIRDDNGLDAALVWLDAQAEKGSSDALHAAAWLLSKDDRLADSVAYARRAVAAGDLGAHVLIGDGLRDLGEAQNALTHYELAMASMDEEATAEAQAHAAELIQTLEGTQAALDWLETRSRTTGSPDPLIDAALLLFHNGRVDEALAYLERAHLHGSESAYDLAADLLIDADRPVEALTYYQRNADISGEYDDLSAATWHLNELHGIDAALDWLRPYVTAGNTNALIATANRLEQAGRFDDALHFCRQAADAGNGRALDRTVDVLKSAGRSDEAESLQKYGWEPDGRIATPWHVTTDGIALEPWAKPRV